MAISNPEIQAMNTPTFLYKGQQHLKLVIRINGPQHPSPTLTMETASIEKSSRLGPNYWGHINVGDGCWGPFILMTSFRCC